MNTDIDNAYEQFLLVKRYFYETSGNPMFHFIVVYNAKSTWGNNIERAEYISRSIASYFSDKFQVVSFKICLASIISSSDSLT